MAARSSGVDTSVGSGTGRSGVELATRWWLGAFDQTVLGVTWQGCSFSGAFPVLPTVPFGLASVLLFVGWWLRSSYEMQKCSGGKSEQLSRELIDVGSVKVAKSAPTSVEFIANNSVDTQTIISHGSGQIVRFVTSGCRLGLRYEPKNSE